MNSGCPTALAYVTEFLSKHLCKGKTQGLSEGRVDGEGAPNIAYKLRHTQQQARVLRNSRTRRGSHRDVRAPSEYHAMGKVQTQAHTGTQGLRYIRVGKSNTHTHTHNHVRDRVE